jgi:3-hydroxyacyl-CoA dehydrogenase
MGLNLRSIFYNFFSINSIDYVGLDTNKFIVDAWLARGDPNLSIYRSKLIETMVAKGNLGKKSGKGFYDYSSGKK